MNEVLIAIEKNLMDISFGMLLFALAYVSNMCLSIYYNVKVLGEVFNKNLIKNSVLKILAFVLGVALLVIVVTTLPMFASHVGFDLPKDFVEVFNAVAIISVPLYASCRYALKSFDKMQKVLNCKSSDGVKEYDDSKLYDNDEFMDAELKYNFDEEADMVAQIPPEKPDIDALDNDRIIDKFEDNKEETIKESK